MTSVKAPASRATSLAALTLKTAGVIVTLVALLDIVILPIPYQFANRQWQIGLVTQFVDRGIVPLVGLALLFAGYWVSHFSGLTTERKPLTDLRFWGAILASVLGLLYILSFPLHLNNVRVSNTTLQEQVTQEAEQAESQLEQLLTTEVQRQRAQIEQLINASDAQLEQAVQAGIINQEQSNLVRQFKENPESLEPFLTQRVQERRNQGQEEIRTRREQAQQTARNDALKSGLRIGIGSLVLAVGYILIGWTGIRTLSQGSTREV